MKQIKLMGLLFLMSCFGNFVFGAPIYYGTPVVFAGNQMEFDLASQSSLTLSGKVPANASNINWKQIGGPAAVIESPTTAATKVSQLSVGWNQFELTASYFDAKGQPKTASSVVNVIVHGNNLLGPAIVPYPKSLQTQAGSLTLNDKSLIAFRQASLAPLADVLADEIFSITGLRLGKASNGRACGNNHIRLALDPSILADEGYRLEINQAGVLIQAKTYRGLAWGTVSMIQALSQDGSLPWLNVEDEPSASYRGVLIDVARKYHPIAYMKELIVLCRLNKINYMQLHLNDIEGTAFPFSNPVLRKVPKEFTIWTLDEVKELVAFADARGVTLVPELEGPGHHAGNLSLLYGRADASGKKMVLDVANDNTYMGMAGLIDELLAVFRSTPYVHIGGDESDLSALGRSPEELAYIEEHQIKDLLSYYIRTMNDIVVSKGKQTIVWEGFSGDGDGLSKDVIVMPFESLYNPPDQLVNQGFQVINTAWKPLYVVGQKNWTPDYIYNAWNMRLWEHHLYPNLHIQLRDDAKVLGAQMCAWEQAAELELPSLRYRLPGVAEKTWNTSSPMDYENFDLRNMQNNAKLERLLGRPQIQTTAKMSNYFGYWVVNQPLTLSLTQPMRLAKLYYTLDGSEPTTASTLYQGAIEISEELSNGVNILFNPRLGGFQTAAALVTLKTRAFDENQQPRGYVPAVTNYWFQKTNGDTSPVPVVNAGPDIEVKLPLNKNTVTITGSVQSPDLEKTTIPVGFKAQWKQVGGSPIIFQKINTASRYQYSIGVINPPIGFYVFQLEAVDSRGNKSRQTMHLRVK